VSFSFLDRCSLVTMLLSVFLALGLVDAQLALVVLGHFLTLLKSEKLCSKENF